ncbi:probable peptidylglycine alpha-hydroxylating monooxygenase 1 [Pomacea canaliculata]|uniref:probable peptidylglycine alpha-hydroxylating monooxygenase 1 n=1 Tax=Pomacea canaliculata TaxID=400727 RepID=UPI000D72C057|nr:probable peptidylglycine alpha-hydroxylating monooxygenase 1 [Pomacea canaliculata]
MPGILCVVILLLGSPVVVANPLQESSQDNLKSLRLVMPAVSPQEPDLYLCHSMNVSNQDIYIREFIPVADKDIAHHILLYGCNEPGSLESVWNCGEMVAQNTQSYQVAPVCASDSKILYAWAMDAPMLKLPDDVAFHVGQNTHIKNLVVQVHYKNVTIFKTTDTKDESGVEIVTMSKPVGRQPRLAGVYLMATGGKIPAHSVEYLEAACDFPDADMEIHPFAFRTHAHKLGRVISGYRVRNKHWEEIGRQDPRLPEMFYNVSNPHLTIRKGDILAARCTMENELDHDVYVGATSNDEMCNFYIMYYTQGSQSLTDDVCLTEGPPLWYWNDFPMQDRLNLAQVPFNASVIPGTRTPLERTAYANSPPWDDYDNTQLHYDSDENGFRGGMENMNSAEVSDVLSDFLGP